MPVHSLPRVIVVATLHWATTTRFCLALAEAGFDVTALVPEGHALHGLPHVVAERLGRTRAQALRKINETVDLDLPDVIVPADDAAIDLLRTLYFRAIRGRGTDPRRMAELIESSVGPPSAFTFAHDKGRFIELAAKEGLPVPTTAPVGDVYDLRELLGTARFPVVLKRDHRFGGQTVRVVQDEFEAERAFRDLRAGGSAVAALQRAARTLDIAPLERLYRRGLAISLQQYVAGRRAHRAVLCHRGTVLAGLSVEALRSDGAQGPATVVRLIDSPDITEAVGRLVRRLGLSGFVGFDFVLEQSTDRPFLIETNRRPTEICHLAFDAASDMIGALAASLGAVPRARAMIDRQISTIALFPQESWRDPSSAFLQLAYHDVPWNSPDFIAAYRKPVPSESPDWLQAMGERLQRVRRTVAGMTATLAGPRASRPAS
jgi:glutathione synthase/RimK-type ligase-like ATP-grasp enzyme